MKNSLKTEKDYLEMQQKIFFLYEKFVSKYDNFYKKKLTSTEINTLNDYKMNGYININKYLYDKKNYFSNIDYDLTDLINYLFSKKKDNNVIENKEVKKNKKDTLIKKIKKDNNHNGKNKCENIYNSKEEFIKDLMAYVYKNSYLDIIKKIQILDKIFLKTPKLNTDVVVYRGVYENVGDTMQGKLKNIKKGDIINFENYISTSMNPKISLGFTTSTNMKSKEKCCFFKINIPKKNRVLFLDTKNVGFSSHHNNDKIYPGSWEYEIVLPRSCLLKFIKMYTLPGTIPHEINTKNLKKSKISSYVVYEFDYLGTDTNREEINTDTLVDKFFDNVNTVKFSIFNYEMKYYKDYLKNIH